MVTLTDTVVNELAYAASEDPNASITLQAEKSQVGEDIVWLDAQLSYAESTPGHLDVYRSYPIHTLFIDRTNAETARRSWDAANAWIAKAQAELRSIVCDLYPTTCLPLAAA